MVWWRIAGTYILWCWLLHLWDICSSTKSSWWNWVYRQVLAWSSLIKVQWTKVFIELIFRLGEQNYPCRVYDPVNVAILYSSVFNNHHRTTRRKHYYPCLTVAFFTSYPTPPPDFFRWPQSYAYFHQYKLDCHWHNSLKRSDRNKGPPFLGF